MLQLSWSAIKQFMTAKGLTPQFVEDDDFIYIFVVEGALSVHCTIDKKHVEQKDDFDTNYRSIANKPVKQQVVTEFERDDKDLKLARGEAAVDNITGIARISILIPGTIGLEGCGRYIAGGDAFIDEFDFGDYCLVYVEDEDRILAGAYGQAAGLGRPMTDEEMQAQGDFPEYPILKHYTDTEVTTPHRGWFMYPESMGNALPPVGWCEVEPIGGYAFVPSGFYLVVELHRATRTDGTFRLNYFWGDKPL